MLSRKRRTRRRCGGALPILQGQRRPWPSYLRSTERSTVLCDLRDLREICTENSSPIRLDFKAVTTLSKIVCLDSEICFGSNLNSATKCLGFCETRKQVSFETVSCVIVEYFCLLIFGCDETGLHDEHSWWYTLGPFPERFPGCFPGCVAESSSSSVHQNLRVRRLHLRAYHWGNWEDHFGAWEWAWREQHYNLC